MDDGLKEKTSEEQLMSTRFLGTRTKIITTINHTEINPSSCKVALDTS